MKLLRGCLKIPERGCVVLDQPQRVTNFKRVQMGVACCGWSATQPRSFFRQALNRTHVVENASNKRRGAENAEKRREGDWFLRTRFSELIGQIKTLRLSAFFAPLRLSPPVSTTWFRLKQLTSSLQQLYPFSPCPLSAAHTPQLCLILPPTLPPLRDLRPVRR